MPGTLDNAMVPTWLPTRDWRGAFDSRYSVIALFRLRYCRWMDESDYIEVGTISVLLELIGRRLSSQGDRRTGRSGDLDKRQQCWRTLSGPRPHEALRAA